LSRAKFEDEKSSSELFESDWLVHGAGCKIFGQVTGNGDPAGFYRMFELAMASFCCNKVPSVSLDHLDNLTDFQDESSGS
jgi:hypothetical protein